MTSLAFIFLLAFLPAESASSRYPPKEASIPVFGPQQVYGLLNGSVTVKCFYPPTSVNKHDRKYWCRESAMGCTTIVSSNGYAAPGYKGRASITDYPEAENFQISISGLTMADKGTYQCGVGINGRGLSHKVSLEVSGGPRVPEGPELFYVKLHGTLAITCSFGSDYAGERKYLCKREKNSCYDIIDSTKKVDEDYIGRVLMSYEDSQGSLSIVITQVSWEDAGLYQCGFGTYGQDGETKELDVAVYEESNVPQAKTTIFGVKGSSATFECHYNPPRKSSVYWCKWKEARCNPIINGLGSYEGRVAMYDSPDNKTVTMILNQLTDSDKGYYWCMTDEKEQQSSIELKIIDGEPGLKGKKKVEAQVGSRVDLTCSYPCKYYSYQKYWCKWSSDDCTPMTASDQSQPGPGVTCDTDNKTVILTFDPVTESDQGWYWCGVKRNGVFGETMAVYLDVTEGRSADHSLDLPEVEAPSHAENGVIPQGRAYSDAGVGSAAASEGSDQSQGPNILLLVLGPVGAVLLILATAFAVFKYRGMKRSDLVSVGSYRTNISMSDFESVKEYSTSNNTCVAESQETQIGGDELITTPATLESAAETKKANRRSKEDADLAYSAFLLTSSSIVQGGSEGDSAAPDVSSPDWGGQV
ncbi:PREDICTED: polymeric immunoglobulin receptor-like [Eurypyga helias]|uniref:polymeric immunoglobulin receptor-like n=1 Tax=Eurypyga helias TaxID=54383 RepID=UPI000528FC06|nr:PREDICTED: polymeric immunoglobulin receptor-like [Eurypyga helias]